LNEPVFLHSFLKVHFLNSSSFSVYLLMILFKPFDWVKFVLVHEGLFREGVDYFGISKFKFWNKPNEIWENFRLVRLILTSRGLLDSQVTFCLNKNKNKRRLQEKICSSPINIVLPYNKKLSLQTKIENHF